MTTKNSIAFDCHTCGRGIVRDSEEHDHSCCDEDNEDNWYCCECFHDFIVKKEASQQAPKCDTKNCECFAAKNKYYPNSEGGEFWTLCEKCYKEDQEEATHDCNQCSYSLTSKEFYAGKGRIMFSEGDGIKEGEYKCDECHKKKKKKKKRKRLVIVDKLCKVCGEELDDDSDNIDGHLCVECDREENGGTLFAESNPIGLLRCKNCKKNDNFFAMDDPELCVPCVDLLYYCNK